MKSIFWTFIVTKLDKFIYSNEKQFLKAEPIFSRLLVATKIDKSIEINFEQESNKYVTNILITKYGSNFKEFILNEKAYNTYRYL